MKVLVAAKRIVPDRTSEGICSSKYVTALASGGDYVTCIAGDLDPSAPEAAGVPRTVRLCPADVQAPGMAARLSRLGRTLERSGVAGRLIDQKVNGACRYATGYPVHAWHEVARWRVAIANALEQETPDVIVTRGAGREFEPHIAMLGQARSAPWIAHYHDPYPGSLYPEPYRLRVPLQSTRQEAVHGRIVTSCDALTFPSQRLLEWVLTGDLARFRHKAFVVPHIASEPSREAQPGSVPDILERKHLNILHAGTLLRERHVRPLLRGFESFLKRGGDRVSVRIVMVGRVDPHHVVTPEWRALSTAGLIKVIASRIDYRAATELARIADSLLILEADAAESPFFPAKLADYLALGKPIIALSPGQSATADILGPGYPLTCPPRDEAAIAETFERVWSSWRQGRLSTLVPPATTVASLSPAVVRARVHEIVSYLREASPRRSQQVA